MFRRSIRMCLAALTGGLLAALPACAQAPKPELVDTGRVIQLHVDGAPFLILGGELGNSSASSRDYLAPHWETFEALGMNTVLAPVYWELVEPEEGVFDFSSVDWLIEDARVHDMRLVLLWFGSFKNSMSSYAPDWVKRDQARFPRVTGPDGRGLEILSAFAEANAEADARAFAALMAHLRDVDGDRHTVIMVQVENEIGMLPTAREHGPVADAAFDGPVPDELMAHLTAHRDTLAPGLAALWQANGARTHGSWAEVFGDGPAGQEVFTAWHYARYADRVAAAGKAAYDLPMYVNAAQGRPGVAPGDYPSGGPLAHLLDVWRAGAPSVDIQSPDIYFNNFSEIIAGYVRPWNPLFIPEANRAGRAEAPADALLAIGRYDALGFSPFSIESIEGAGADMLAQAYRMLDGMAPLVLAAQGTDRLHAFRPPSAHDGTLDASSQAAIIGDYEFTIRFGSPWQAADSQTPEAYGLLVLQDGPEDYILAGRGVTVTFAPAGRPAAAGIDRAVEGRFEKGEWIPGRRMNGDQTHQGRHVLLGTEGFSVQRVRLYTFR